LNLVHVMFGEPVTVPWRDGLFAGACTGRPDRGLA
jgi:hypothetical protein